MNYKKVRMINLSTMVSLGVVLIYLLEKNYNTYALEDLSHSMITPLLENNPQNILVDMDFGKNTPVKIKRKYGLLLDYEFLKWRMPVKKIQGSNNKSIKKTLACGSWGIYQNLSEIVRFSTNVAAIKELADVVQMISSLKILQDHQAERAIEKTLQVLQSNILYDERIWALGILASLQTHVFKNRKHYIKDIYDGHFVSRGELELGLLKGILNFSNILCSRIDDNAHK